MEEKHLFSFCPAWRREDEAQILISCSEKMMAEKMPLLLLLLRSVLQYRSNENLWRTKKKQCVHWSIFTSVNKITSTRSIVSENGKWRKTSTHTHTFAYIFFFSLNVYSSRQLKRRCLRQPPNELTFGINTHHVLYQECFNMFMTLIGSSSSQ